MSAGLLFQQQKQTAPLMPHTGSEAFTAAAAVGPDAASVLGGPLLAGQYQQHSHLHPHGQPASPGGAASPIMSSQPINIPEKTTSPSQQQQLLSQGEL